MRKIDNIQFKKYALCSGTGHNSFKLNAFDRALIAAKLSDYNLLKVSSILPPRCQRQEIITLNKGMVLASAFASIYSNTIGDIISAAVAVGVPEDENDIGVIIEHSAHLDKRCTEEMARSFVVTAMKDRGISIKEIHSVAIECLVELNEVYCAIASVSMW